MAKYFGTNGVRGTLDLITPPFVSRMAFAFGRWSGGGGARADVGAKGGATARSGMGAKILVGRDTRTSGPALQQAVMAGLQSAGCEPVDFGVIPSPTMEYAVRAQKPAGAIIVTASHNPPEYNALKFVDENGIAVSKERGEEIEEIFEAAASTPTTPKNKIKSYARAIQDHAEAVIAKIDAEKMKTRKLKLVLDCANGTMGALAPALFRKLGCSVQTLNAQPDGNFPGRMSEPTEANITGLTASVKALNADAGIAWDGDGDRVVFVDEKGNYVIGDKVFALSVQIALKEAGKKAKGAKVVTTVATTNAIAEIAARHGASTLLTKVGGPYISEEMRRSGALVGGEEVGGVVWPSLHYGKDGLITAAKICGAMCTSPLSKLISTLPTYYNSKTKIITDKKSELLEKMRQKLHGAGRLTTIDGVRVDYEDGAWAIVRASGTEGALRIFAEAKTKQRADEMRAGLSKTARQLA